MAISPPAAMAPVGACRCRRIAPASASRHGTLSATPRRRRRPAGRRSSSARPPAGAADEGQDDPAIRTDERRRAVHCRSPRPAHGPGAADNARGIGASCRRTGVEAPCHSARRPARVTARAAIGQASAGSPTRIRIGREVLAAEQLRQAAGARPCLGAHLLLALDLAGRLPGEPEVLAARRPDRLVVAGAQGAGVDLALGGIAAAGGELLLGASQADGDRLDRFVSSASAAWSGSEAVSTTSR